MKLKNIQVLKNNFLNSNEFKNKFFLSTNSPKPSLKSKDKLCFLHIPKCAGTTLHGVLVKEFSTGDICKERFNGLKNWPLNYLAQFKLFSGHFDYQSVLLLDIAPENIITTLRDPLERLISLYYFLKSHKAPFALQQNMGLVKLTHDNDIEDFFALPEVRNHPSINNTYTRTLTTDLPFKRWEEFDVNVVRNTIKSTELKAQELQKLACSRLASMHYVTMSGDFDLKLSKLLQSVGIKYDDQIKKQQVLSEITQSSSNLMPVEVKEISPSLEQSLRGLVDLDYQVYNYALKNEVY